MSTAQIIVRHCMANTGHPFLVLEDLPLDLCGEGAEVSPEMARAYAHALLQAADDCENPELGHTKPNVLSLRKRYDLATGGKA